MCLLSNVLFVFQYAPYQTLSFVKRNNYVLHDLLKLLSFRQSMTIIYT